MESKFAKSAYWNFFIWGVCSSLGIAISTIVDATLVGNLIGSEGLAVANIATPVFLAYSLLGVTIGMGANVLLGRKLGASDVDEANRIFNTQILTGAIVGVVFMALSVLFREQVCRALGATDELLPLATQYLTVVFASAPLFVLYQILAVSVRTDGDPKLAAIASATVIVANLSLDLLFMLGFNWGIVGASASLCIAEGLGVLVLLLHFVKKHALLRFRLILPHWADIKKFVSNGFGIGSAFIFQAAIMLAFNTLLLAGGSASGVQNVAVFGVVYTMSMVSFAVFDGAGSAISTVVSIFAGEKDGKSMMLVLRQAVAIVSAAGVLITIVFLLQAENILRFFGLGAGPLGTASLAFQIFSISILFTGINTVITSFWQAIGRSRMAGFVSIARNLLLMLTLGAIFIPRYQIIGLGAAYVCCEAICLIGIVVVNLFKNSKVFIEKQYQFSNRVFEKYYIIETESITQISADLEQLCEDWEINPKQAFFINLIVEELMVNIMKFGMTDNRKKHYLAVKLMDNVDEYIIRIRDNVNTYNPFDSSGDAVDAAAIQMIRKKTQYCDYQRKLIFNYLYLII